MRTEVVATDPIGPLRLASEAGKALPLPFAQLANIP